MLKRNKGPIISGAIFLLVITALNVLALTTLLNQYGEEILGVQTAHWQLFFRILGIGIPGFWIVFKSKMATNISTESLMQRDVLLKKLKTLWVKSIDKEYDISLEELNIRFWVELKNPFKKIRLKKFNRKVFICQRNEQLADNVADNLYFEVYPNEEGGIGICYNQGKGEVIASHNQHDDPEMALDKNMNEFQKQQTRNMKFLLCIPLYNSKGQIKKIVSFDSPYAIPKQHIDSVVSELRVLCDFLQNNMPDNLGKRREVSA
ncbi:hypothetical protein [Virgibacillus siamensis]|uniref:hypothetical protein n=1 Tax=Virgibacillus siamensis TaxID=480071 RepID=UPI000984605E|nr:hypothetical protein [Virgibacillus siamensis]